MCYNKMSTLQGFTDGSYDYRQMYNVQDLRGPLPECRVSIDTIYGYLMQNGLNFASIISKSRISAQYSNSQSTFTVFVPLDIGSWENETNLYKIQQLLLAHTLERPLSMGFLKRSLGMRLTTMQDGAYILCENIEGKTILNRTSVVLKEIKVGGANIFLIDRPIVLDEDPLAHTSI